MNNLKLIRLLRANTRGCVAGCQANQPVPDFGSLMRIPLDGGLTVFGLVYDIHIDDDGLVRQLTAAGEIPEEVIQDNRANRNVPLELSILFVGYEQNGLASHLLPPRPPLSLDAIYPCTPDEVCRFTDAGHYGYFRHILAMQEVIPADLLAAHLVQAGRAQLAAGSAGWLQEAVREVITLLRDDHSTLTAVLGAIADAFPHINSERQA